MSKAVVIGAGPAGMMAAVAAAGNSCEVVIAEKNKIVGKKLLITGKGRCNVTNNCSKEEFLKNIPVNSRFLYSSISKFSPQDTMQFFEELGVKLKTERGNRVFPESDRSADVAGAMKKRLNECKVKVVGQSALKILTENGAVSGVLFSDGSTILCDSVILATGGLSYPLTGSTGDGFKMAAELGHTIVEPTPSLVPLIIEEKWCSRLAGLALKNISISVVDNTVSRSIFSDFGEMLFTHTGISGPISLSASSHIRQMQQGRYTISLDLKPALSEEQLDARLLREFEENKNKDMRNVVIHLLPTSMVDVFCERLPFDGDKKINSITKEERTSVIALLKKFTMSVKFFAPIDEAIVTSGGVSVKEIDPKTMQSKLVKGLYFAGEIIDVDAYTGGFNLQIAFSTGYAAGSSIY